jgi:hypothetical protein
MRKRKRIGSFSSQGQCAEHPVKQVAMVQRDLFWTEPMLEINPKTSILGAASCFRTQG